MQCKAAVVKAFMAFRKSVPQQMQLDLQPVETVRVIPNELYEELMTIESKPKRMKLMKLYKAIAAKGQTL
jgi:hypothetical protein